MSGGVATAKKTAQPSSPQTLMQAHEELVRIRPRAKASLAAWLSYYRHSVAVYQRVAETDFGHDGEALYWAQRERAHAKQIEARMSLLGPGN
jgi:hypothetical protein